MCAAGRWAAHRHEALVGSWSDLKRCPFAVRCCRQVPASVINAMCSYMTHSYAQLGAGHAVSNRAGERARCHGRRSLNTQSRQLQADDPKCLRGATLAQSTLARCCPAWLGGLQSCSRDRLKHYAGTIPLVGPTPGTWRSWQYLPGVDHSDDSNALQQWCLTVSTSPKHKPTTADS